VVWSDSGVGTFGQIRQTVTSVQISALIEAAV
jgi:hypothetical protein